MAKAKKSEDKPAKKPASAKPAAKSAGAKAPTKRTSGGASPAPAIDTNLAASAAAAMILNRAAGGGASPTPSGGMAQQSRKESAGFKQLKQNLAKPSGTGPGGILSNPSLQKKSSQPFGGPQQKGHNQTFGADVNRTGVPRRTGGG